MPNVIKSTHEEKNLIEWDAFERPQKKWGKDFYSTVIVMAILASIIFYFIDGIMPVLVIWSLVFMLWAMSHTEPRKEHYGLTSWGLRTAEGIYRYEDMSAFWLETKWGGRLLRINLRHAPWHIVIVIDSEKENSIRKNLLDNVPYQEPPITWLDRVVKWLSEKIPME